MLQHLLGRRQSVEFWEIYLHQAALLQDPTSQLGELVVDVLETCFAMLPRIQLMDVQVGRLKGVGPARLPPAL